MDIVSNKRSIIVSLVLYVVLLISLSFVLPIDPVLSYIVLLLAGLVPGIVGAFMLNSSKYSDGLVIGVISVFLGNIVLIFPQFIFFLVLGAYPAYFENILTIFNNSFSPVIAFEMLAAVGGIAAVFINKKFRRGSAPKE